jgi:nucleoside phosphorylase
MQADVVVIVALDDEIRALREPGHRQYGATWRTIRSNQTIRSYEFTTINSLRIAAVKASGMGQLQAAMVTLDAITDFDPAALLLIGIAAAVADEIEFGDIVIANRVVDFDLGKVTDEDTQHQLLQPPLSPGLLAQIEAFKDTSWKRLLSVPRPDGTPPETIRCHVGGFGCSNKVVASGAEAKRLAATMLKLIALEMESAGIATAIQLQHAHPPQLG